VPGEWPSLPFNLVAVAGAENPLPEPVHLVKLDTDNAVWVGEQDAVITLKAVPGFKLEVKAGSVTFPDGKKAGKLSVTPVNADKVPMPPPNGMQPQFIVTIQPAGARFDPPARITLPNVDGRKPGAQVEMYSFDHDLEEFVAVGLGTVSADGRVIESNPGARRRRHKSRLVLRQPAGRRRVRRWLPGLHGLRRVLQRLRAARQRPTIGFAQYRWGLQEAGLL